MLYGKSKINLKITREENLIYTAFSLVVREKDFAVLGPFLPSVIFFFTIIKFL